MSALHTTHPTFFWLSDLESVFVTVSGKSEQFELIGSNIQFSGISTDSRSIQPGNLFIALRGDNFDGHVFIADVMSRGAAAVVVDHKIPDCDMPQIVVSDTTKALGLIGKRYRQAFNGVLVAITGSCGKTSVKGMLRAIFEQAGETFATPGNFNNHIGVPLTLSQLSPDHKYAVIEMGASAAGEIHYLTHLAEPSIALVNNVRPAHVSGFGSVRAIAKEKGQIYTSLKPGIGVAVINRDDAYAEDYLAATQAYRQICFSRKVDSLSTGQVTARSIHINPDGCASFELNAGSVSATVNLQVLGEHFVDNALAAASCALAAGLSIEQISQGLESYGGESGRMQKVLLALKTQRATLVDDAYNANPGSVAVAIHYLANFSQQTGLPSTLVLGDMGELGDEEIDEHKSVGHYALTQGVTELVGIGPLSRYAVAEFEGSSASFATCEQAVDHVIEKLKSPGVVLIKGSRSSNVNRLVQLINESVQNSTRENIAPC